MPLSMEKLEQVTALMNIQRFSGTERPSHQLTRNSSAAHTNSPGEGPRLPLNPRRNIAKTKTFIPEKQNFLPKNKNF
jgi:hypothetical protein